MQDVFIYYYVALMYVTVAVLVMELVSMGISYIDIEIIDEYLPHLSQVRNLGKHGILTIGYSAVAIILFHLCFEITAPKSVFDDNGK